MVPSLQFFFILSQSVGVLTSQAHQNFPHVKFSAAALPVMVESDSTASTAAERRTAAEVIPTFSLVVIGGALRH
jgi:hypothetical protein